MQIIFAQQLHDRFSDGNAVQVAIAPFFEPKNEGEVTTSTKVAVSCTPMSGLAAAREQARKLLIEDYRVREQERIAKQLENRSKEQEEEFEQLQLDVCALYGTAETKWEKLWDDTYFQHYYYNWQTKYRSGRHIRRRCAVAWIKVFRWINGYNTTKR